MEIATLNLVVRDYLKHIHVLSEIGSEYGLAFHCSHLRNFWRLALGCRHKIFPIPLEISLCFRKLVLAVIGKCNVVVRFVKLVIVCSSKVLYGLVVFVAKHYKRSSAIEIEYRIVGIPAVQL